MQMDTVSCREVDGFKYILTVICLFSRWSRLIPIVDRRGEEIGEKLLTVVMAPCYQFPVVLRSDNAREFIAGAVAHINSRLEVAQIQEPLTILRRKERWKEFTERSMS